MLIWYHSWDGDSIQSAGTTLSLRRLDPPYHCVEVWCSKQPTTRRIWQVGQGIPGFDDLRDGTPAEAVDWV